MKVPMSKKLYALSLILSLFFTNSMLCMITPPDGAPVTAPAGGGERKEAHEITETQSLWHAITQHIVIAMRNFNLEPEEFRLLPMSEGSFELNQEEKIIKINERHPWGHDEIIWTAYYIAAHIHHANKVGILDEKNSSEVCSMTCAKLLELGKGDIVLQRMAHLVGIIIAHDTAKNFVEMLKEQLLSIIRYLNSCQGLSNFKLSKSNAALTIILHGETTNLKCDNFKPVFHFNDPKNISREKFDALLQKINAIQPEPKCCVIL